MVQIDFDNTLKKGKMVFVNTWLSNFYQIIIVTSFVYVGIKELTDNLKVYSLSELTTSNQIFPIAVITVGVLGSFIVGRNLRDSRKLHCIKGSSPSINQKITLQILKAWDADIVIKNDSYLIGYVHTTATNSFTQMSLFFEGENIYANMVPLGSANRSLISMPKRDTLLLIFPFSSKKNLLKFEEAFESNLTLSRGMPTDFLRWDTLSPKLKKVIMEQHWLKDSTSDDQDQIKLKTSIAEAFANRITPPPIQVGLSHFGWRKNMLFAIVKDDAKKLPKEFSGIPVNKGVIIEEKSNGLSSVRFDFGMSEDLDLSEKIKVT